jgi:response regulator RpfG family c-di-GMP phosphodiesterase
MAMLSLLLIDPSNEWLKEAHDFFSKDNYIVSSTNNGKQAQRQIYQHGKYFAVILNFSVTEHSGPQVLKYIKTTHPTQKVIVVVDPDLLDETEFEISDIKKMGANEIVTVPFSLDDVKMILEGEQNADEYLARIPRGKKSSPEEEVVCVDEKFTKVPIEEFLSMESVIFDIYIRLSKDHYVKILHAGDIFNPARIEKWKTKKGVSHLYFQTSDRMKYVRFCNRLTKSLGRRAKIGIGVKSNLIKNASEKIIEEAFSEGMNQKLIHEGQEISENIYEMVSSEKELYKILRQLHEFDPAAFTKSYITTVFTTACVRQFAWQGHIISRTAALAALYHDIGYIKLPEGLYHKNVKEMTDEEIEAYKKHPEIGAKLLKIDHSMITNSIQQIVYQHHECSDGSGFPMGITDFKILTIAKTLHLVDDFVHDIMHLKIPPIEMIKKLLKNKERLQKYNGEVLEKFIMAFLDPELIRPLIEKKQRGKKNSKLSF